MWSTSALPPRPRPPSTEYWMVFVRPGRPLTINENILIITLKWITLGSSCARVISIDPVEECCRLFKINIPKCTKFALSIDSCSRPATVPHTQWLIVAALKTTTSNAPGSSVFKSQFNRNFCRAPYATVRPASSAGDPPAPSATDCTKREALATCVPNSII